MTDKLSEKAGDLKSANERLRALINIGLELASERDSDRLLDSAKALASCYVDMVDLVPPYFNLSR